MTTTVLSSLLDYLHGSLSADNMRWLGEHLIEYSKQEDAKLKPYTMDELDSMLDEAEAEIAAGKGTPHEEVMREMDEEIARWKAEEEYPLPEGVKPYTIEELNARIDKAERDSAEGRYRDFDDFMRELEEKFAVEDRKELAMMEAV